MQPRKLKARLQSLCPSSPFYVPACHTKCGEAPQINSYFGLTLPQLFFFFSLKEEFFFLCGSQLIISKAYFCGLPMERNAEKEQLLLRFYAFLNISDGAAMLLENCSFISCKGLLALRFEKQVKLT